MASALSPGGYVRQGQRGVSPPRSVNVQVAVRCRPINDRERTSGERSVLKCLPDRREVVCAAPATQRKGGSSLSAPKKTYTYDHVFGPDATQADVYEGIVEPIVDEVLQGYNCTVFAYGQTGTGKTHTMEGRRDADMVGIEERRLAQNAGIIPRAVKQVFDHLRSITDEHSVRVSHLELYNEQLTDLLSPEDVTSDSLRMYEDPHKGTFVQGLEDIVVRSEEEIFAVLDKSALKRRTAETLMNKYSSRSHSVFSITIHIKESTPEGADLLKVGKLNLVDLAGSENVGRSGAVRGRAREAGNINQSLLTLGRVITALVDRHPHVPYRDSKLTRLLQESLGGRNKTCVIATITPASNSVEETASTLDYAYRAKSIKNRPTVNQMIAKHVLLKEYTEEIQKLKKELDANRAKHGVFLPPEEFQRLQQIASQQKDAISDLESRNEDFEKRTAALKEKLEKTQVALARDQKKLEQTKHTLDEVRDDLEHAKSALAITSQQKEENAHLVRSHVASETSLHEQGTQLQSTLSVCLSDIDALHRRVDTKFQIEKENVTNLASLRQTVGNSLDAFRDSLDVHEKEHVSMLQLSDSAIAKLATTVNDELSGIASKMEEFSSHFSELEAKHARTNTESVIGFQEANAANLVTLRQKSTEQQSAVSDADRRVVELGTSISASLEKSRAAMADMKSLVSSYNEERGARQSQFAEELQTLLSNLSTRASEYINRQDAVFSEMQLRNKEELERQKSLAQAAQEKLISQVTRSLQTFVQDSCDGFDRTAAAAEESVTQASAESANIKVAVEDVALTFTSKCSLYSQDLKGNAARLEQCVQTSDALMGDLTRDAQVHVEEVKKSVNNVLQSTNDWHADVGEGLTSMQLAHIRFQEESEEQLRNASDLRKTELASHFQEERVIGEIVQQKAATACDEIRSVIADGRGKLSNFVANGKGALESDVREPIVSHAVICDRAHDETPILRQWPIAEGLVRTEDHTSLIGRLRKTKGYGDVPLEDFGHIVPNSPRIALEMAVMKHCSEPSDVPESAENDPPLLDDKGHVPEMEVIEVAPGAEEQRSEGTGTGIMSSNSVEVCDQPSEEAVVLTDATNAANTMKRHRRVRSKRGIESLGVKKPSGIPAPKSRSIRRVDAQR